MKKSFISFTAFVMCLAMLFTFAQSVYAEGSAPVAENLELRTYRAVSVSGQLSAYDPDGDVLDFTITTRPVKGEIELNDDGSFVYTPAEGKKGRDYFGYKAVDSMGNTSQEATVIIKIEKQSRDVFYTDMRGRGDEYAAVQLSELGIFTGEQLGGKYCFYPDKEVSRGEFLSMCMMITGKPLVMSTIGTGFVDDMLIPAHLKNYVASAVMCGLCTSAAEMGESFAADEPISRSEAAMLLDKAMNITNVSYVPLENALPDELAQACVNLSACGISGMDPSVDGSLSRAEMARMLSGAIEILSRR